MIPEVSHPGKLLPRYFANAVTVEDAAQCMGISTQSLQDIIDGKAPFTKEIATLLSLVLPSNNPDMWINLQARYDTCRAFHDKKLREYIENKYLKTEEDKYHSTNFSLSHTLT